LLLLPLAAGCGKERSLPPSGPAAVETTADLTAQSSPEYTRARQRFAARDYAGALVLLDQLLARPSLTEADRRFLEQQRTLCRDAQEGRSGTPVGPVPSPVPATSRTAEATSATADCGPRALLLVCQSLNIPATLPQLTRVAGTTDQGTTLKGLAKAADAVGLKAKGVQMDENALARLSTPAVAWVEGNHFVAVLRVHGDSVTVRDPSAKEKEVLPLRELIARSGGVMLLLSPPKNPKS
jgi:hypothetical protein